MHTLRVIYLDGSEGRFEADSWNFNSTYFTLELLDDDGCVEKTIYQVCSFKVL